MPQGISDTDLEAARVHTELLKKASIAQRLGLAVALSTTVLHLSRAALARGDTSSREAGVWFVQLHYGAELAEGVRAHLARQRL